MRTSRWQGRRGSGSEPETTPSWDGGGTITKVTPAAHQPDRFRLFVDDRILGTLDGATILQENLTPGTRLSQEQLRGLRLRADEQALREASLNFLSFRPRSEQEVRRYLRRRGAEESTAESILTELRRLGFVDDHAFAAYWVENRERFQPRGERLVRQELRHKGVAREEIDAVTDATDEERETQLALRAAEPYARRLDGLPWQEFRAKLGGHLMRRGFSYEIASTVTKVLWRRPGHELDEDDEDQE